MTGPLEESITAVFTLFDDFIEETHEQVILTTSVHQRIVVSRQNFELF